MKTTFVLKPPERFYRDGPPDWRQGRGGHPAETSIDAEQARDLAVKRLRGEAATGLTSDENTG